MGYAQVNEQRGGREAPPLDVEQPVKHLPHAGSFLGVGIPHRLRSAPHHTNATHQRAASHPPPEGRVGTFMSVAKSESQSEGMGRPCPLEMACSICRLLRPLKGICCVTISQKMIPKLVGMMHA